MPANSAGIVIYKIKPDGSLDGRWTHPDLDGRVATERAKGGTPGKFAGTRSVEVATADDKKLFEGSLTIEEDGDAFLLTWSGTQLLPKPRKARFTGVGALEKADTLAATFQEEFARDGATFREVWDKLPGPKGEQYADAYSHGSLRVLLYAPRVIDPQTPHEQDEVYVVMKGSGFFFLEGTRRPFAEGDVLFAPAGAVHRFEDFTDNLILWVVFYGPNGGESDGDPRAEIERANSDFGHAVAQGDAHAVAAMYVENAKVLPPNAPIVEGRAAIETFWKGVISSGITGVDLQTTEVEAFGDTVVEYGAATLSANEKVVDRAKYLVVWKRIEGVWKLYRDCWNSNNPAKTP